MKTQAQKDQATRIARNQYAAKAKAKAIPAAKLVNLSVEQLGLIEYCLGKAALLVINHKPSLEEVEMLRGMIKDVIEDKDAAPGDVHDFYEPGNWEPYRRPNFGAPVK